MWAVPGRFFQSLPVPYGVCMSVVTNRAGQGRAAMAATTGGWVRCHFY